MILGDSMVPVLVRDRPQGSERDTVGKHVARGVGYISHLRAREWSDLMFQKKKNLSRLTPLTDRQKQFVSNQALEHA